MICEVSREIRCKDGNQIQLALNEIKWPTVVNTGMNLWIS